MCSRVRLVWCDESIYRSHISRRIHTTNIDSLHRPIFLSVLKYHIFQDSTSSHNVVHIICMPDPRRTGKNIAASEQQIIDVLSSFSKCFLCVRKCLLSLRFLVRHRLQKNPKLRVYSINQPVKSIDHNSRYDELGFKWCPYACSNIYKQG